MCAQLLFGCLCIDYLVTMRNVSNVERGLDILIRTLF